MTQWPDWQTVAEQSREVQLQFRIDLALANYVVLRVTTRMDV